MGWSKPLPKISATFTPKGAPIAIMHHTSLKHAHLVNISYQNVYTKYHDVPQCVHHELLNSTGGVPLLAQRHGTPNGSTDQFQGLL